MTFETTDIFFAAFLKDRYTLITVSKTNGHKLSFKFEVDQDNIKLRMGYQESEFYKVKDKIERLKSLGD